MKVIDFYKKGAHVIVEAPTHDMTSSFTASKKGGEISIGYTPSGNAKPVSGAAYDVVAHNSTRYLILRHGFLYEVRIVIGGVHRDDVISAEYDHVILQLPNNYDEVIVKPVEE